MLIYFLQNVFLEYIPITAFHAREKSKTTFYTTIMFSNNWK